jgi:hypothetical protein
LPCSRVGFRREEQVDPDHVDRLAAAGSRQHKYVRGVDTAGWYRYFAEVEALESSPTYRLLADAVTGDHVVLEHVKLLSNAKGQPNLLFASVQFLGGPTAEWATSRSFVLKSWDQVADSPVHIEVEWAGTVPVRSVMPEICWRGGVNLNPLDVNDSDDVAWLRPASGRSITQGDLNEEVDVLIDSAPTDATTVVFHAAVPSYVLPAQRQTFAAKMNDRADVVWISNEAPGVVTRPPGFRVRELHTVSRTSNGQEDLSPLWFPRCCRHFIEQTLHEDKPPSLGSHQEATHDAPAYTRLSPHDDPDRSRLRLGQRQLDGCFVVDHTGGHASVRSRRREGDGGGAPT